MKDPVKMVVVLTAICFIAALALSQVYALTEQPIAQAKRMEKLAAIKLVMPPYDNEPDQDTKVVGDRTYYVGTKDGAPVGYAMEAVSHDGYSGDIKVMLGILPDGEVNGLEVLEHKETPGLGQKIETQGWRDGVIYTGADHKQRRTLGNTKWNVKKDSGDIDQISGATISPRAVVGSVYDKLKSYEADKGQLGAAEQAPEATGIADAAPESEPAVPDTAEQPVTDQAADDAAKTEQVNP